MAGNSKNFLPTFHLVNDGDMSVDITSSATNISYIDNISIQCNISGTPTGTIYIQGSLDHSSNAITNQTINSGNWINITSGSAAGAAANILFDLNQLSFPWIRIFYDASSGSGTLNAYISGKAV